MTLRDKYGPQADRWTEAAYADAEAYLAHRAELTVALGPRLEAGDTVLDLACGDGGLADHLPRLRYLGVDASPEMVAAARRRGVLIVATLFTRHARRPQRLRATAAGDRDDLLSRDLLHA